ncbi:MAG: contractile injection system protein, VgrG/Pvc8 family [Pseudomonadota bacterium]|uniref:contractile injection system protein, VgrG/Pvc8 family n=1 Tax=Gallaecimonas pentaromativorans TaxID=584787 RepID=UPI00067F2D65|nr:contractile injection system protein, VgrG/Pvc8 family [Gallaecimonas pentaromativorans]MED5523364.1 contractile injection system protein, VgrG/Pvc8 family [Pseudomonadota bacterium]
MNQPINSTQIATLEGPQPAQFLHVTITLSDGRKLGDETFRLVSLQGQESVSQPFEFQLELHANTQNGPLPVPKPRLEAINFNQVMGQPVTFAITLPWLRQDDRSFESDLEASSQRFAEAMNGGNSAGFRWFNGIITGFAMGAPGVYHATVKPALWKLTLANRYQVHKGMTVIAALQAVLSRHDIRHIDSQRVQDLAVNRSQDWLQAGESDFDFFQRLLGKAYLYYYFRHHPGYHELVLSNSAHYPDRARALPLRYAYTGTEELGLEQDDVISDYRFEQTLSVAAIQSLLTDQQEAWQVDGDPRLNNFAAPEHAKEMLAMFRQHKVFQYGSNKDEASIFHAKASQARLASASMLSGSSYCADFCAGFTFTLTDALAGASLDPLVDAQRPIQPQLKDQGFVLTKVQHQASIDGSYKNSFEATEVEGLVAPFSLGDTQQGSILGTVVSHSDPDLRPASWKYGYAGDFDGDTSPYIFDQQALPYRQFHPPGAEGVYVRFATDGDHDKPSWVKLSAYMETTPEIGAQVVIGRSNDESELPEISQVVHSSGTQTCTPSGWQARTDIGSNFSTRYGDGINIGFGRGMNASDARVALQKAVTIVQTAYGTAAGDNQTAPNPNAPMGRFRDAGYSQGASYNFATANSTAKAASQDLAGTYGSLGPTDDLLRVDESFGSSFGQSQGQVSSSVQHYGVSYSNSTFGRTEAYDTVTGTAYRKSVNKGASTTVSENYGAISTTSTIVANSDSTTSQTGNSVDSRTTTGNTTSSNTVTGTAKNSTQITTQKNNSTIGINDSLDLVGMTNTLNLTGMSDAMSLTGMSTSLNVSGLSNQIGVSGQSSQINIAGSSTNIDIAGNANTVRLHGPGLELIEEAEKLKLTLEDLKIVINSALSIIL